MLSAAMKGEARRVVAPELAERVRAVLTKAMVGIRYERTEGGMFLALDTTLSEPQVAQLESKRIGRPRRPTAGFWSLPGTWKGRCTEPCVYLTCRAHLRLGAP